MFKRTGQALTAYTSHLKKDGLKDAPIAVDLSFINNEAPDERAIMD